MRKKDAKYPALYTSIFRIFRNKCIAGLRDQADSDEFQNIMPKSKTIKRKRIENLSILAKEVCDTICVQAKDRFTFLGHLSAGKLLRSENFSQFFKNFPSEELNEAVKAYLSYVK